MKLLIDANIILDVLQERQPHYANSLAVWEMCEQNLAEGFISVLTFANVVYVLRKDIDANGIAKLFSILKKSHEDSSAYRRRAEGCCQYAVEGF